MSFKSLALAAFSTVVLSTMVSGLPQEMDAIAQNQISVQSTSIDLESSELNQPLWLSINALNGANLQGQIKLNGRMIQRINGSETQVNLSNYLSRGEHQLMVTGSYYPSHSSVIIELNSNTTQVSQQTSGTGSLNQQLTIGVR
ncbi:MAG: hypothetical protein AAGF26_12340 [Cyanobacteria bacterium P01_G01_bin.49]